MASEEKQNGGEKNNTPNWEEYFGTYKPGYQHIIKDPYEQLVVYTKENFNEERFLKWAEENKLYQSSKVQIGGLCGTCDNDLILLTGEGIRNFIQTESAGGGSSGKSGGPTTESASGGSAGKGGGPTGETSDIYYMFNAKGKLVFPEQNNQQEFKPIIDTVPYQFTQKVNVAVFDTGVDQDLITGYLYEPRPDDDPCMDKNAGKGWDFTDNSNTFGDDYPGRHGTLVARLIIEQALHYHNNPVRILPVKIHNAAGDSDIYSVLCGIAYAKERGAHLINASFGFYAPRNPSMVMYEQRRILLLRRYIDKYLTKNKILLVAAAGNRSADYYDADFRDLDYFSFYPASFARNHSNVFAVTTSDEENVCPTQNYSPSVVDVGVIAENSNYEFQNPLDGGLTMIKGSSFAAPVLTGKLAANYTTIKKILQGRLITKKNVIDTLLNYDIVPNGPTLPKDERRIAKLRPMLTDQIRNGVVIRRKEE